jgi:hypothetical protein
VTDTKCVRCARPMADQAYACSNCAYRAGDQLHTIVDVTPAARDIAHGFARHGTGGGGSKPGSRLPFDLGATAKLDGVQNELTGWVRHIAAERGLALPRPVDLGDDVLVLAAGWLAGHVEWMRHREEVDAFLADVGAAVRVVSGIARGPASQRYLGPCGAELEAGAATCPALCMCRSGGPGTLAAACEACACLTGCHGAMSKAGPCEGDIYARDGASAGRCRTCGATVATSERQAWLDGEVRSHAFRAAEIGKAYGVNVNTIRSWASRPRPDTGVPSLASYWRTAGGLVTPWTDLPLDADLKGDALKKRLGEIADEIQARGGRLHYVGDVLDLAAADAARRATEQAKRARRAADREAAESEEAT